MKQKVSVVIIARNEERDIARCIQSVKRQRHPKEIIVVDDCSTDRTAAIARKAGARIVMNKENLGIARSLNAGIKASKGDVVITFHADAEMVGNNWIGQILKTLEPEDIGAVTGYRVPKFTGEPGAIEKVYLYFAGAYVASEPKGVEEILWLPTRCDAFKRKALEDVGYFNPRLKISGDCIDISTRLRKKGYRLLMDPKCVTRINLSAQQNTFGKILKKRVNFGKVVPYLLKKYGLSIVTNKSWFFSTVPYIAYFWLVLLSFLNPVFLLPLLLENMILSLRIAKVTGRSSFLAAFVLIPIYTILWNLGIIYGLFIMGREVI